MTAFNTDYLNRTVNKDARQNAPYQPLFVVWHETASPNADNPRGTLEYNLQAAAASSYHYLIARDGTVYHYVDETRYVAWHAGLRRAGVPATYVLNGQTWSGYGINLASIGVEVDGPNDGTPITAAQRDSIVRLLLYFRDTYSIPLDTTHHREHKQLADQPYKTDPQAYSIAAALALVPADPPPPAASIKVATAMANVLLATAELKAALHDAGMTA